MTIIYTLIHICNIQHYYFCQFVNTHFIQGNFFFFFFDGENGPSTGFGLAGTIDFQARANLSPEHKLVSCIPAVNSSATRIFLLMTVHSISALEGRLTHWTPISKHWIAGSFELRTLDPEASTIPLRHATPALEPFVRILIFQFSLALIKVTFSYCLSVCLFGLKLLNALTKKLHFWYGGTS